MSDPAPNPNAITKAQPSPASRLSDFLRPRMKNLAEYGRGLVKPENLMRLACFEMTRPEAKWLTQASHESIYASLIIAAQLGLEIGARAEAYLVPFGGKCTLMPSYRGLIKLAVRSGEVKHVRAHVVYAGDDFAVTLGSEERIHHKPMLGRTLDGEAYPEIIAAYAIAEMKDGSAVFDVMDGWELDKHRAASQMANGPAWKQWGEEMYRKTPVRRLFKYLPAGEDYYRAARVDDLVNSGKADQVGEVIDLPPEASTETPEQDTRSPIQKAAERASK
jgi:recombination protein RecT